MANRFDWLQELYKMEEIDVKQKCGTEATLYLAYLRLCSQFFLTSNPPFSDL